tara:strand:+ start:121013 stop:121513 length:501 start_codon:yes stop_codon:yes gene_type:complete
MKREELKELIRQTLSESGDEKRKIIKHLIKKGANPVDAKKDVDKHYAHVKKKYGNAPLSKKAEVIVTLAGTASEGTITEKKTMDTKTIVKVAKYTDQNQHTLARFLVAKEARFSKLEKSYQLLYNLHEHIGHATQGLTTLRYEFDKELKSLLKKNYSNWLEIWNGL